MWMWGGAGAKKGEEMSLSDSSMGKKDRGKETACNEECRKENIQLFLQHEALHCWGRLQKCEHLQRQMTDARGRKISEWQLPLRYWWGGDSRMRKVLSLDRWRGVWEPSDPYSFSYSCTDPGWVYSGSPSCRGSGPSPTPSSFGPSSHFLQAWYHSTLPETQRCPEPLHNPRGGWGEQSIDLPCSTLQCAHSHYSIYTALPLIIPMSSLALLPFLPESQSGCTHSDCSAHLQFSATCFSQCRADWRGRGERGREWVKQRGDRTQQPVVIYTGPECIASSVNPPSTLSATFIAWQKKSTISGKLNGRAGIK